MTKDVILKTVQGLITEGQCVITSKFDAGKKGVMYGGARPTGVDLQSFSKWQGWVQEPCPIAWGFCGTLERNL